MKLETFTPRLNSFLKEASAIALRSYAPSKVPTVGLHINPNDGYVGLATHSEKIEGSAALGIPEFDDPEVHYTHFDEWDENYWNKKENVSFADKEVSMESCQGDEEYAEIFVEWSMSVLKDFAQSSDSPFSGIMLCVHPVSSDPYRLWDPKIKA
ncbi:MAG: hypothetical protein AAFX93_15865 [Verrucomicrobiota bacterium]